MYMFVCERVREWETKMCGLDSLASQIVTLNILLVVVCFSSYFVGVHNAYMYIYIYIYIYIYKG